VAPAGAAANAKPTGEVANEEQTVDQNCADRAGEVAKTFWAEPADLAPQVKLPAELDAICVHCCGFPRPLGGPMHFADEVCNLIVYQIGVSQSKIHIK
jgi:hypothetical protein